MLSVVAAATENNHDRKDHDPSAVIVKDVAQAVIHYVCLRELLRDRSRLVSYYAEDKIRLIKIEADGSVLNNKLGRKALSRLGNESVELSG